MVEFIEINGKKLPPTRSYTGRGHSQGKTRECAFYQNGEYMTRGAVTEVDRAASVTNRYMAIGWCIARGDKVEIELDVNPALGKYPLAEDTPCLCWGGPRLTLEEFRRWMKESSP
jgi:hypothetical protein